MTALRKNSVVRIRLANVFLIVALFAATGTDWIILQSVAWVRMAANLFAESRALQPPTPPPRVAFL